MFTIGNTLHDIALTIWTLLSFLLGTLLGLGLWAAGIKLLGWTVTSGAIVLVLPVAWWFRSALIQTHRSILEGSMFSVRCPALLGLVPMGASVSFSMMWVTTVYLGPFYALYFAARVL